MPSHNILTVIEFARSFRKIYSLLVLAWVITGCTFLEYGSFHHPSVSSSSISSKPLGDGIVFKVEDLCLGISEGSGTYYQILGGPYYLTVLPAFLNPFQYLRAVDWYEERQWITLDFEPLASGIELDLQKTHLVLKTGEKITPDLYLLWYLYSQKEKLQPITPNTQTVKIKHGFNSPVNNYKKEIKPERDFWDGFRPPAQAPPPIYEQVTPPIVTRIWLGFKKPEGDADFQHLIINGIKKDHLTLPIPIIDITKQSEFRFRSFPSEKPTNIRDSPDMFLHGLCVHNQSPVNTNGIGP